MRRDGFDQEANIVAIEPNSPNSQISWLIYSKHYVLFELCGRYHYQLGALSSRHSVGNTKSLAVALRRINESVARRMKVNQKTA
jgi:hypothetical protein